MNQDDIGYIRDYWQKLRLFRPRGTFWVDYRILTNFVRTCQGAGQRANHKRTLPLCPAHHRTGGFGVAIHTGQKTRESKYGTELDLLDQVTTEVKVLRLCRV